MVHTLISEGWHLLERGAVDVDDDLAGAWLGKLHLLRLDVDLRGSRKEAVSSQGCNSGLRESEQAERASVLTCPGVAILVVTSVT